MGLTLPHSHVDAQRIQTPHDSNVVSPRTISSLSPEGVPQFSPQLPSPQLMQQTHNLLTSPSNNPMVQNQQNNLAKSSEEIENEFDWDSIL